MQRTNPFRITEIQLNRRISLVAAGAATLFTVSATTLENLRNTNIQELDSNSKNTQPTFNRK